MAKCKLQEKLFTKLESHFIPLASDITGQQVIKVAFASATSQQKKLLQSKLYNEGVLLSLLAFNGGSNIVQPLPFTLLHIAGGTWRRWSYVHMLPRWVPMSFASSWAMSVTQTIAACSPGVTNMK